MELKKSKKADLEKYRSAFLQIGFIIVLSLTLFAFNWKTKPVLYNQTKEISGAVFEPDIIQITKREEVKPQITELKLIEILSIVPNDFLINDDFNFDLDATPDTRFRISDDDFEPDTDEPVTFLPVEDMPRFNGGDPDIEFRKYISQNLIYPEIAAENGVRGKVYVQFVINSKGKLVDAKVVGPIDPALDEESLRVINSSPTWVPGKQRGKPVKFLYTFPINFVLK